MIACSPIRMVCVVPEHVTREAVSARSETSAACGPAIARGLTFRVDLSWSSARPRRRGAVTDNCDWFANERLARAVAVGNLRSIKQSARHQHDLDGSLVQIALTKEP